MEPRVSTHLKTPAEDCIHVAVKAAMDDSGRVASDSASGVPLPATTLAPEPDWLYASNLRKRAAGPVGKPTDTADEMGAVPAGVEELNKERDVPQQTLELARHPEHEPTLASIEQQPPNHDQRQPELPPAPHAHQNPLDQMQQDEVSALRAKVSHLQATVRSLQLDKETLSSDLAALQVATKQALAEANTQTQRAVAASDELKAAKVTANTLKAVVELAEEVFTGMGAKLRAIRDEVEVAEEGDRPLRSLPPRRSHPDDDVDDDEYPALANLSPETGRAQRIAVMDAAIRSKDALIRRQTEYIRELKAEKEALEGHLVQLAGDNEALVERLEAVAAGVAQVANARGMAGRRRR